MCIRDRPDADLFRKRLTAMGITSYLHYPIPGYPNDIDYIVSDEADLTPKVARGARTAKHFCACLLYTSSGRRARERA